MIGWKPVRIRRLHSVPGPGGAGGASRSPLSGRWCRRRGSEIPAGSCNNCFLDVVIAWDIWISRHVPDIPEDLLVDNEQIVPAQVQPLQGVEFVEYPGVS